MKKIFVTFVIAVGCMLMAMPVQAQLNFGVKGGLNMSKLDLKHGPSSDNTTGFFIGPMAEVTIPVIGLGVDAALMYSQRGEHEWKQQGIEIPVNLKYTIGLGSTLGVFVAAGPDFFFNFNDADGLDKKESQVGLNLGAGLKLLRHIQLGVNYQIPLNDSFKVADEGAKTKSWQVSLAYLF